MILTSVSGLYLQHDEELSLLRMAWAGGPNPTDMQPAAAGLLAMARALGVRRLLFDLNQLPNVGALDETWLSTHWLAALAKLPLACVVLVLDQGQIHNHLVAEEMLRHLPPDAHFDVQYFSEAGPALDWLTDGSPRLPALLAEWADHPAHPARGRNSRG